MTLRPSILNLDDSLTSQGSLIDRVQAAGGLVMSDGGIGPRLRLWCRDPILKQLHFRLDAHYPISTPELVFVGSGDFHHVTPLLIDRALTASRSQATTVLHFDNHPDWVRFSPGVHCGSWVARAARITRVQRLISVGICSGDIGRRGSRNGDLELVRQGRVEIYPYRDPDGGSVLALCNKLWPLINYKSDGEIAELLMSRIETPDVYITIDKDVLRSADAVTNWDQGGLSLETLLSVIGRVSRTHRIIGADVVGDWSPIHYGGPWWERALKYGEAWLDQPHDHPDAADAIKVNERANLKILDALCKTLV